LTPEDKKIEDEKEAKKKKDDADKLKREENAKILNSV
jgi:hypothetical protein